MTEQSEYCHCVKVLAPDSPNGSYPVLFWPPEGGFKTGASSGYDVDAQADVLICKGLIVAQLNYRVGPFGFWSTGTAEAAGNYAMWTVIEALKWMKSEIQAFGGDPNKITCQGQGAGGITRDFLSLNPDTQNQFAGFSM